MPLFESRIIGNTEVARDYMQMDFSWPEHVASPEPGQFLTVRAGAGPVPLLRRPFGVSAFRSGPDAAASMIYWRRGTGTRILSGYEPGDSMSVMAPLGVGFPAPSQGTVPLLVAGGVGIGPILYFANTLAGSGFHPVLLLGARTKAYLPTMAIHPAVQLRLATDDGSEGFSGTAIDLLRRTIGVTAGTLELYLCGPDPMLRAGHYVALEHNIPTWVSMEQTMGCAVGACMGCAVRVTGPDQYARVCTEGPVFRSTEIVWE